MPDLSPDAASSPAAGSPPARVNRGWGLLTILLASLLGLALLACYIVIVEVNVGLVTEGSSYESPLYWAIRVPAYGLPLGLTALAIRRFVVAGRRRPYWIGLGVAGTLLLLPWSSMYLLAFIVISTFALFAR